MAATVVKMSAKGQLVVPDDIREEERLRPGDLFVSVKVKDGVLFRRIDLRKEFDEVSAMVRQTFKKNKVTPATLREAKQWAREQL